MSKKGCKLCTLDQKQLLSWYGQKKDATKVKGRLFNMHRIIVSEDDVRAHFSQHGVQRQISVKVQSALSKELKERHRRVLLILQRLGLTYTQTLIKLAYIGHYSTVNAARAAAYRDLSWLKWNGYIQSEAPLKKDPYRPHWDRRQEIIRLSAIGEQYLAIEGYETPVHYEQKVMRMQSVADRIGLLAADDYALGKKITYKGYDGREHKIAPVYQGEKTMLIEDSEHVAADVYLQRIEAYIGFAKLKPIVVTRRAAVLARAWKTSRRSWEGIKHEPPLFVSVPQLLIVDSNGDKRTLETILN